MANEEKIVEDVLNGVGRLFKGVGALAVGSVGLLTKAGEAVTGMDLGVGNGLLGISAGLAESAVTGKSLNDSYDVKSMQGAMENQVSLLVYEAQMAKNCGDTYEYDEKIEKAFSIYKKYMKSAYPNYPDENLEKDFKIKFKLF